MSSAYRLGKSPAALGVLRRAVWTVAASYSDSVFRAKYCIISNIKTPRVYLLIS